MISAARRALASVSLAAVVVLSCGGPGRSALDPDVRAQMARGVAYVDSLAVLAARAADERGVGAQDAVALGYAERLRLGLGSPFRLIDYALRDPRFGSDSTRRAVAWSLLAHTLDGAAYDVDAAAAGQLAVLTSYAPGARAAAGRRQLALIDSVFDEAADPRVAELTLRLAYRMAVAEGSAAPAAVTLGAQVAALVRDRRLSMRDARRLVDAARRADDADPLALVPTWRAERKFIVERPPLAPLGEQAEMQAMRAAPLVLARLRRLEGGASDDLNAAADAPASRAEALLPVAAARRLAALASVRGAPPQAPVAVAMRGYRQFQHQHQWSREQRWGGAAAAAARARFGTRALTEESIAAEYALLRGTVPRDGRAALAALSAAVALRAYAQEAVWFPGFPAPTVAELKSRLGLASISFDQGVPAAWRPYYLRMVASAVTDLERVLPSLSLRGAGLHIGEGVLRDTALAMHDPATRTIYLPVASGAGTIAHELAHDLDWQAARTLYGRRGGYGSDRAVREHRGRLAAAVAGLTSVELVPPLRENSYSPPFAQRPAEVLARSFDWFVAAALAREGRSNGYLSAVQDGLLAGYASAAAPGAMAADAGGAGRGGRADDGGGSPAHALVDALDDVAPPDSAIRAWFLDEYGPRRAWGAYEALRRATDARLGAPAGASGLTAHPLFDPGALDGAVDADPPAPCGVGARANPARIALVRQLQSAAAEAR
ncbi:MAG TPA: hypothetical protein VKA84_17920, partial [Gemmatimonadaceae bacterium]|nr:hypothetical protein [Gemmatimonadaceae bacterium]